MPPTFGPPRGPAGVNDEGAILRPLPCQPLRYFSLQRRCLLPVRLLLVLICAAGWCVHHMYARAKGLRWGVGRGGR